MRRLIWALALVPGMAAAQEVPGLLVPAPIPEGRVVQGIVVPHGYRVAWPDGRVNPARGPRTAAGDAQMAAVWTDTVPRELVAPADRGAALRGGRTWVVAGRYATLAEAEAAGARVVGARVAVAQGTRTGIFRVLIGPYATADAARDGLDAAHAAGLRPRILR